MKKSVFMSLLLALAGTVMASAAEFDRGLGNQQTTFIPKGTIAVSLSGGYNNWKANGEDDNSGVLLAQLINNVNGNVALMNVNAGAAVFVSDNLSFGVRFGYGNTAVDLNQADLMGVLKLDNKHIRTETYTGAMALRQYMPLFDSRVFALFFEGRLSGSFGYNKNYGVSDRGKEGTYADLYTAALGIYPGITVFATDKVSFEASLPLLEGVLEWDMQIKGQAHESALTRKSVNFKPGLLGLNFGIVYHF